MVALYDEHKRWVGEKENGVSLCRLGHNVRLPACYCYWYWYWVSLMTRHRSCNWNLRPYDDSNFGHNKGREREREREWKVRGRDNWPRVFSLLWLSLFSLHCLPHTHTHSKLSFCVFISIYDEIHVTQYLFLARTPKKKRQSSVLECDIPMTKEISAKRILCCILCRELSL